jgi:hypothetical protein
MAVHFTVHKHDVVFEDMEYLATFDTERKARFYGRMYSRHHPFSDVIITRARKRICAFRAANEMDPIKLS